MERRLTGITRIHIQLERPGPERLARGPRRAAAAARSEEY
jgi:hypothetical protein